ncbi:holo-ACP synthase [Microbulbifer sp. EKSA008]|uniref:holo-ACP synthase n=1 Tax=unclassified Microbulbifer TaxID=2619833 RepID=UPI0039B5EA10
MIVSIGTDICNYDRIEVAWQRFGDRFVERVLSSAERKDFYAMAEPIRAAYLCKRFAAKEAVAKALGTGIGEGVSWQDIDVRRRKGAAPQVVLAGAAEERAEKLGVDRIHLSLSDEKDSALAFVVFESC